MVSSEVAPDLPAIRYTVRFPEPGQHVFEVSLEISGLAAGQHRLSLPVWTPGSYEVVDFARNLFDLSASTPGGPLMLDHETKNRWGFRLEAAARVHVHYRIWAYELSVHGAHLDATHAYWNGAQMFLLVDDYRNRPHDVFIECPPGWRVSTGLDALPEAPGWYRAGDYDTLIDCPVEVGTQAVYSFSVDDIPHQVAVWGHGNEDPAVLIPDIERIVRTHRDLFGELPYRHYTFLLQLTDRGTGGLEHLNSTTCGIQRFMFRPRKSYRRVLALLSHEFFHLWNVKRIHPEALGPFDYDREVYTRLLWAMEGFTDYYAYLALVRGGLYTPKEYLQGLGDRIKRYEALPGRFVQSLAESSFDTWIKLYKPGPDSPNRTISYYLKGDLVGTCLDLELRRRTDGRGSLDEVLRRLYRRYGRHGVGFPEQAYLETLEEVGEGSFAEFYAHYIEGTDALPIDTYLGYAGLAVERGYRPSEDEDKDAESSPAGEDKETAKPLVTTPRPWLGVELKVRDGHRLMVATSYRPGPAAAALYPDDELIALNGYRIDDLKGLQQRLRLDHRPGEVVLVTCFRLGRLETVAITLGTAPFDHVRVRPQETAAPEARRLFQDWLKVPWPA